MKPKDLSHGPLEASACDRVSEPPTDRKPQAVLTEPVGSKMHRQHPPALTQLARKDGPEIPARQAMPTPKHSTRRVLLSLGCLGFVGIHLRRIGTTGSERKERAGLRGTSQPGLAVAGHPPRRRLWDRGESLSPHTRPRLSPMAFSRGNPHTRSGEPERSRARTSHTMRCPEFSECEPWLDRAPSADKRIAQSEDPPTRRKAAAHTLNSSTPGTQGRRRRLLLSIIYGSHTHTRREAIKRT